MVLSEPCVCVSSAYFWPACFCSLESDAWNCAVWGRHPHLAPLVCALNKSDPFPGIIHHNRSDYIWSWWSLLVPDSSVFSRQAFFLSFLSLRKDCIQVFAWVLRGWFLFRLMLLYGYMGEVKIRKVLLEFWAAGMKFTIVLSSCEISLIALDCETSASDK